MYLFILHWSKMNGLSTIPPFTKVFPIRNGWYGGFNPGDVSDESFLDAILGATVP